MPDDTPTLTHWGAYRIRTEAGRLAGVAPAADDPEPSPIGRSLLDTRDHPLRVTRPMVRAGYLAGGPGPTDRRGSDPFVAVDWDTATALAAGALAETKARHGPRAIYGGSYGWGSAGRFHQAGAQLHRFLALFGGFTGSHNTYSSGAAEVVLPHVLMPLRQLQACQPSWGEVAAHGRLVVAFGGLALKNAQVNWGGVARHRAAAGVAACAAAGVRFVSVSPLRADADGVPGAEWLPIRPGTDAAVMLAMAHVLATEGLADEPFAARCCAGWPRWRAHLTGDADGVPKTPEWAAALSGVPAARIAELARALAAQRSLLTVSWSVQRADHGEQPVWAAVALAALAGSMGRRGGGMAVGPNAMHSLGSGEAAAPFAALPAPRGAVAGAIPVARVADMLLHPGARYRFNGVERTYPDIRLVHWAGGNPFHHHQDLNRLQRAWGRPDTVIVHESFWTATARRADIVLPAATVLERDDIGVGAGEATLLAMKRALPPPGLAETDHRILARLAARLGFADRFTEGRGEAEWLRWLYQASRPRLAAAGIDAPPFDAFWAAERLERPPASAPAPPCATLRADPAAHPLPTPSGKVELWSAAIAAMALSGCPGHPTWAEPAEWLGGAGAAAHQLHLLSNQPAARLHSQLDFGRASLAAKRGGREPCRLHPADAAARGIADGDTVRLFNDRGACFATATLDDGVMPGVAVLATGAWFDPADPADPLSPCRHGNPNALTRDVGTSPLAQASSAQTCLVGIARVAPGEAPAPAAHHPPAMLPAGVADLHQ